MKILQKNILSIIVFILILGLIFIKSNKLEIFSIITIIFCIISFLKFYIIKRKIKEGIYIKVGKNKRTFLPYLMLTVTCFFIIITNYYNFGNYEDDTNKYSSYIILFLLTFIFIFNYNDFILLVKEDSIEFNYSNTKDVWRISKIVKVIINKNSISFYKKDDEINITLKEKEDIVLAKNFLTERLKEKVIIEA